MKDVHPLTQHIPEVAVQGDLETDIAQNGLRDPVVLHEDRVIEGRVRYRACLAIGVEPRFREFDGKDPFTWMVKHHIESHELSRMETIQFAGQLVPYYKTTKGAMAPKMAASTGLGQHTIRQIVKFVEHRILDKVVDGEISWTDALRRVGLANTVQIKLGTYYGKGDRFDDSMEPPKRYLAAWRARGFEYRHVPPKEAARRIRIIDELIDGLQAARADLEPRSVRPRHTTPSK